MNTVQTDGAERERDREIKESTWHAFHLVFWPHRSSEFCMEQDKNPAVTHYLLCHKTHELALLIVAGLSSLRGKGIYNYNWPASHMAEDVEITKKRRETLTKVCKQEFLVCGSCEWLKLHEVGLAVSLDWVEVLTKSVQARTDTASSVVTDCNFLPSEHLKITLLIVFY